MDNIRITSGKYRGRSIKSPKSAQTHPMGSREKIALFNMISEYLPEADVLDAFAGSGALGIEAISRGANSADFIEKSPKIAQNLINNLAILGISSSDVSILDVKKYTSTKKYDIIIADPPYGEFVPNTILYLTKYLKNGGIFVLSHPGTTPEISGLKLTKTHKYAAANITIYQKQS